MNWIVSLPEATRLGRSIVGGSYRPFGIGTEGAAGEKGRHHQQTGKQIPHAVTSDSSWLTPAGNLPVAQARIPPAANSTK